MHKLTQYTKSVVTVLFLSLVCMAVQAQLPSETNGSWKVRRTKPGATPSGWTLLNHDDTAWPAATLVSIPSCLTPFNQTPVNFLGTIGLPIWANNGTSCSTPGDVVLFRKKFTVNKSSSCLYKIMIKVDNTSQIYVNGTLIGSTFNNWGTGNEFDITNNIVNGNNIIAIRATDDAAGVTAWLSAVIRAFCP